MTREPSEKAKRIFDQNFHAAIDHIDRQGVDEPFDAWHRLVNRGGERICRRTVEDVLIECEAAERVLNWQIRKGFEPFRPEPTMRKALRIVRNTCENWLKREEEIADI